MNDVATLAHEAVRQAASQPRQKREASVTVRKLFVLLHGAYGSTFLSKYSTGEKNDEGSDKGVVAAMLVWDAALSKFAPDVVEAMSSHRPYRPSLGMETALEEIRSGRGTLYHSQSVDACLHLIAEKKVDLTTSQW